MNDNLKEIANRINSHDHYYMMSDSNAVYQKGEREAREINTICKTLTAQEVKEMATMLIEYVWETPFGKQITEFLDALPKEEKEPSVMSTINKAAWYYLKKGVYATWKEAIRAAWKAFKIKARMTKENVTITFRKATGEIRIILVAALKGYTKKSDRPTKYSPDVIRFVDVKENKIKSARIERIISYKAA